MQSIFPELFFLSYFALAVIRIAVAGVLLFDAWRLSKQGGMPKRLSIIELVLGCAIVVGVLTQAAVVAAGILIVIASTRKDIDSQFKNRPLAILSIAILATLFLSGPGGLAIDLPY